MTKEGKIKILIWTNGVHNVIHYGLPREIDTLVQQMGRAGRDGEPSHELIIYVHKGQLRQVEEELVQLAKYSPCRRDILCASYGSKILKSWSNAHVLLYLRKLCKCELNDDCPYTNPCTFIWIARRFAWSNEPRI